MVRLLLLPWALLQFACLDNVWACQEETGSSHVRRSDRALQSTGKGESFRVGDFTWENAQAFLDSGARCYTRSPSSDEVEEDRQRVGAWERSRDPDYRNRRRLATVTIDVYWHTIISSGGAGQLTAQQINDSIAVLNGAYNSAGFQFNLVASDVTTQNTWYNLAVDSRAESNMRAALYKGSMAALNVYSVNAQDGLLGWATFPMWELEKQDGVVILYSTVPGGTAAPYNEGDTLTHEVSRNVANTSTLVLPIL